jgi:hypothetical protein
VPVYVDDARIRWRGLRWSHLVADTAEELHAAAATLGIPRHGARESGRTLHYDLPEEWRERAIAAGVAQPIEWRELARRRDSLATSRRRGEREAVGSVDARVAEDYRGSGEALDPPSPAACRRRRA